MLSKILKPLCLASSCLLLHSATPSADTPPHPYLFSWGLNINGQLGDGTQSSRSIPVQIPFNFQHSIFRIFASKFNSAVLTEKGELYLWGRTQEGLAGASFGVTAKCETTPRKLSFSESKNDSKNDFIEDFSLGNTHAGLIVNGKVYTWGLDVQGKLGQDYIASQELDLRNYSEKGSTGVIKIPTLASMFSKVGQSKKVFCNYNNTFVVDGSGKLWVVGSGERGVSGTGSRQRTLLEAMEVDLAGVEQLKIGSNFVIALNGGGEVFGWGLNNYGQLGSSENMSQPTPQKIKIGMGDERVQGLAVGEFFSVALTGKGEVWSWGQGVSGQLGHGNRSDSYAPKKVEFEGKFKGVAAGDSHTVLLDEKGQVFVCGEGKDGQIGRGEENESSASYRTKPSRVEFFVRNNIRVDQVGAGGNHCLALAHYL